MNKNAKFPVVTFAIILTVLIILSFVSGFFYIVNAGERGVMLTWGDASTIPKSEGLGFKMPIAQRVVKMSIQTQKYEASATAASKDLQIVTAKIVTNYHLIGDQVPRLYREIGIDYADKVIQPMEQEVVKATTAQYTAEELITKREDVRQAIKNVMTDRLQERGIVVEEISITDFDFSPSFNQAIEAKVTAEQLKLKAERDLERIKIEKEQKIAQAQAEAESLRLQKQEITPELLTLRAIEKWNGVTPIVVGGGIPFIDIASVIQK
jgi:regulator of protease activity HflC (stomatin/prohibitin superfamily)